MLHNIPMICRSAVSSRSRSGFRRHIDWGSGIWHFDLEYQTHNPVIYSIFIAYFLFMHIFKCTVQLCTHSVRTVTTLGTSCPTLFE